MNDILQEMIEIIRLSPSRQKQIYFNATADLNQKTLLLDSTIEHFLKNRTGDKDTDYLIEEANFHLGLAIGSLEEWLRDERINYTLNENFDNKLGSVKVTLL